MFRVDVSSSEESALSLADEIQKLEELRRTGALSELEFSDAKAALIRGASNISETQGEKYLIDQLEDIRYKNELAQIDREWDIESEQYFVYGQHGRKLPPSTTLAAASFALSVFGIFWTIMALSITSNAPDAGPFALAKVIFPLFGIVFTVGSVAYGIHILSKAQKYQKALADYKARRASHRNDSPA
jgi:hypothetical protein